MLWYPVPGFPDLEANEDGDIRSKRLKRLRKSDSIRTGSSSSRLRRYFKAVNSEGIRKHLYVHRAVLSAKLGRPLEPWEDARHLNGDPSDNRMENLKAGCRLNNIIDDLEAGRLKTSREQIDIAMQRLQALREKIE